MLQFQAMQPIGNKQLLQQYQSTVFIRNLSLCSNLGPFEFPAHPTCMRLISQSAPKCFKVLELCNCLASASAFSQKWPSMKPKTLKKILSLSRRLNPDPLKATRAFMPKIKKLWRRSPSVIGYSQLIKIETRGDGRCFRAEQPGQNQPCSQWITLRLSRQFRYFSIKLLLHLFYFRGKKSSFKVLILKKSEARRLIECCEFQHSTKYMQEVYYNYRISRTKYNSWCISNIRTI